MIVKNIFFFINSQPKHMLWVLKRTVSLFKLMDKKILTALWPSYCLSDNLYSDLNINVNYFAECLSRICYGNIKEPSQ